VGETFKKETTRLEKKESFKDSTVLDTARTMKKNLAKKRGWEPSSDSKKRRKCGLGGHQHETVCETRRKKGTTYH